MDTIKCEMKLVKDSTEDAKKRLQEAEKALAVRLDKAVKDKVELAEAK